MADIIRIIGVGSFAQDPQQEATRNGAPTAAPSPISPANAEPQTLEKHKQLSAHLFTKLQNVQNQLEQEQKRLKLAQAMIQDYQRQWAELVEHDRKMRGIVANIQEQARIKAKATHEQLAKFKADLDNAMALLSQSEVATLQLKQQLANSENSLDQAETKNAGLRKELEKLQEHAAGADSREATFKARLTEAEQTLTETRSELSRQEALSAKLREAELRALHTLSSESARLQTQVEEARHQSDTHHAEAVKLRNELTQTQGALEQKRTQAEQLKREFETHRTELASTRLELERTRTALEAEKSAFNTFRQDTASKTEDLTSKLETERNTLAAVKQEMVKVDEACERFLKERADLVRRGDQAYAEITRLRSEATELASAADQDREAMKAEIVQARAEHECTQTEARALQAELESARLRIQELDTAQHEWISAHKRAQDQIKFKEQDISEAHSRERELRTAFEAERSSKLEAISKIRDAEVRAESYCQERDCSVVAREKNEIELRNLQQVLEKTRQEMRLREVEISTLKHALTKSMRNAHQLETQLSQSQRKPDPAP